MGSTNVSLRDEAYEALEKQRREGESFSDVVLRLVDEQRRGFEESFGKYADTDLAAGVERVQRGLEGDLEASVEGISPGRDDREE